MGIEEIGLAALLCDFQRFYKEEPNVFLERYKELFQKYVELPMVIGILKGDEKYQEQCKMIKKAKEYSLYEIDHVRSKSPTSILSCIFSRLSLSDEDRVEGYGYSKKAFSINAGFPTLNVVEEEGDKLRESFEEEMVQLKQSSPTAIADFMILFDTILKKYLWCVPASDLEDDISLYDHLKSTAAIARCLFLAEDKEKPFCMVTGAFSGIQNYIFSIVSMNVPDVTKRLRARSFLVDILVTVIAHDIMKQFQMPLTNIMMLTGGKFFLLLPNSEQAQEKLDKIEAKVQQEFFRMFHGEIAVNLASLEISGVGLRNYSQTVFEVLGRLSAKKNCQFSHVLIDEDGWRQEAFTPFGDLKEKTPCPVCGKSLIGKKEEHCESCSLQWEIGKSLPKAKYLLLSQKEGDFLIYPGYYLSLRSAVDEEDGYYVEQFDDTPFYKAPFPPVLYRRPMTIKYRANYVPANLTFSDLAEEAVGNSQLAVLKADVDYLGFLFAEGFRRADRHMGTISRVSIMSRMLEVFFSGYVNNLLRQEYPKVYSVFSGGDDLFLIGPWNQMIDMGISLQKKLKEFTAMNPCITLSAAIISYRPKTHIAFMAEDSEIYLKKVKNQGDCILYPEKNGRNGVSLEGVVFTWEDFEAQIAIGKEMVKLINQSMINMGTINRISTYSNMYKNFLQTQDVLSLMFVPLMAYDQNRNYKEYKKPEQKWFLKYAKELEENTADWKHIKKNLYFADSMISYAKKSTKKGRKDGTKF